MCITYKHVHSVIIGASFQVVLVLALKTDGETQMISFLIEEKCRPRRMMNTHYLQECSQERRKVHQDSSKQEAKLVRSLYEHNAKLEMIASNHQTHPMAGRLFILICLLKLPI